MGEPKQPPKKIEKTEVRTGLPSDFNDKLDNLRWMKANVNHRYQDTIWQLNAILNGRDPDGIRQQYYQDWSDEDIRKLIEESKN